MTTYEEHLLHRKLRALSERGVLDERQRRLYRKLCLRNTKRFPFSVFQKAVFFSVSSRSFTRFAPFTLYH